MPDPKPTHPVARAIWEALGKQRLFSPWDIKSAKMIPVEVEIWDRIATEAESAHRREGGEDGEG